MQAGTQHSNNKIGSKAGARQGCLALCFASAVSLIKSRLSDKIKLKDFLGIQKFDTEKLREVIKVIRVHSQDEIEIEWNFDDIFSEQR